MPSVALDVPCSVISPICIAASNVPASCFRISCSGPGFGAGISCRSAVRAANAAPPRAETVRRMLQSFIGFLGDGFVRGRQGEQSDARAPGAESWMRGERDRLAQTVPPAPAMLTALFLLPLLAAGDPRVEANIPYRTVGK